AVAVGGQLQPERLQPAHELVPLSRAAGAGSGRDVGQRYLPLASAGGSASMPLTRRQRHPVGAAFRRREPPVRVPDIVGVAMAAAPEEIHDSPSGWVAEHIRRYVETDGRSGHEWRGVHPLLLTTRGRKPGQTRRTALLHA